MSSCLAIRNHYGELTSVADWLNGWMQRHAIAGPIAQRVDLCCTEAVTNIITHGFDPGVSQEIRLRLDCDGGAVALEIEDEARAFDPAASVPARRPDSPDDVPVGGWGLPIIHHFSDICRYRRAAGRNLLVLTFHTEIDGLRVEATE